VRPIDLILAKIPQYTQHGANYRACCPGHGGDNPTTLSLTEAEDGKPLIHCFKGCNPEVVLNALGLTWADLFPHDDTRRHDALAIGRKHRRHRPPQTDADKLTLVSATAHICGLILGPVPAALPDEALGPYVGVAELLWDVYTEQGTHEAVQAEYVNLRESLRVSAPQLLASVGRRLRSLRGQPSRNATTGDQESPKFQPITGTQLLNMEFPRFPRI
jgi:hypothetical protein